MILMFGAFIAVSVFSVNVALVILVCVLVGLLRVRNPQRGKSIMIANLFWAFFRLVCSVSAEDAALPLIQQQVVQTYGWLSMTEFADVITISQMTPGPIAINAASFVGIRIAGIQLAGGDAGLCASVPGDCAIVSHAAL